MLAHSFSLCMNTSKSTCTLDTSDIWNSMRKSEIHNDNVAGYVHMHDWLDFDYESRCL